MFYSLFSTTHKNGIKRESIRCSRTGSPQVFPVMALHHQVEHLRHHNVPADTPLATVYNNSRVNIIHVKKFTAAF